MLVTPRRTPRTRTSALPDAGLPQTRAGAVVPFDAAARLELTGRPGHIIQDVLNVSPDAIFVAVAIGYAFEQERMRPLQLQYEAADPATPSPAQLLLRNFPTVAWVEGFRVHPDFTNVICAPAGGVGGIGDYSTQPVSRD